MSFVSYLIATPGANVGNAYGGATTSAILQRLSEMFPYDVIVKKDATTIIARRADGSEVDSDTSGSGDNAVIQAALSEGGHVYFKKPSSAFNVTSDLTVPSDTWVDGDGWACLFQRTSGIIMKNSDFGGSTNSNIFVSNVAFKCTSPGALTDGNLVFDGTTNVHVWKVKSTDSPSECIKARNCTYAQFAGNHVERSKISGGTGKAGIMFSATTTGRTCVMVDNHAVDCGGEGLGVNGAAGASALHHVTITGNTSRILTGGQGYRGQIHVEGSSGNTEYVNVSGNTVHSDYYGISVLNCKTVQANSNIISHLSTSALTGINVSGSVDYLTCSGNTIKNAAQHAISLGASARRYTITNNTIINPGQATSNTYDGIIITPSGGACREALVKDNNIIDDQGTPLMRYGVHLNPGTTQIINGNIGGNSIHTALTAAIGFTLGTSGRIETCNIKDNMGWSPYGVVTNPFNATNDEVGLPGRGSNSTFQAAPEASTDYTVILTDIKLVSTGGTGVSITVKDNAGTTIESGLSTYSGIIPRRMKVNFGAFSVAPTVVVAAL